MKKRYIYIKRLATALLPISLVSASAITLSSCTKTTTTSSSTSQKQESLEESFSSLTTIDDLAKFTNNISGEYLEKTKNLLVQSGYCSESDSISSPNVIVSRDQNSDKLKVKLTFNIIHENNNIKVETKDITTNINLIKINTSILENKLKAQPLTANELASLSKTKLLQTLQSFNCGIDNLDLITESSLKLTYKGKELPILRKADQFTSFTMQLSLGCNENSVFIIDNQIPSILSLSNNNKTFSKTISNVEISSEDAIAQSLWVFEDPAKTIIIGLSEFGKTQPKLVIPSNVTTIRKILSNVNDINTNVKEIQFNDNSHLLNLGNGAFEGFKSLTSINLPSTIKVIGNATFKNCSKLTSIKIANGIDNDLSNLTITEIPQSCFEGCSSINNLKFAQNTNTPENFAFKDCTSLNSITFGNNPANDWINLNWTQINESVFENTGAFEKIFLPQNLNSIGRRAFAKSKIRFYSLNQTENTIDNKLKFIEDEAFYECKNFSSLFSVFSPNSGAKDGFINTSLESIGNRAFMNSRISYFYTPYPVYQDKYNELFFNTSKTFTIGSSAFENTFVPNYGFDDSGSISGLTFTNYVLVYPNWQFLGTNTFKNSEACILLNCAKAELPNYSYLEENFCDGWMGKMITKSSPRNSFTDPNGVIYFQYNDPSTNLTSEQINENIVIGKIMKKTFSNCTTSTLKEIVINGSSVVIGWPEGNNEIWWNNYQK